jgi:multisubunit Na+/H+ antiporter MnhE subunit
MTRLLALFEFLFNLIRNAARSGWQAGKIILLRPRSVQSGLVRCDYGELGEGPASLLAAVITLTPGTTAVEVDADKRELLLHLLDLEQAEATLEEIRRELIGPLTRLTGGRG